MVSIIRLAHAKEKVRNLENILVKIFEFKKQKKRKKLIEFKGSYNNNNTINQTITHIIGVPEGKMIQKETEKLCEEIMTGNFPNLMKFVNISFQET